MSTPELSSLPTAEVWSGADDTTVLGWAWAYVEALAAELPIAAAALFGSRARGNSLRTSDADLAIISPSFAALGPFERLERAYQPERWDGLRAGIDLEVVTFAPDELLHLKRSLTWDVLADGIVLADDGTFAAARARFDSALAAGDLQRTAWGWRFTDRVGAADADGEAVSGA